MAWRYTARRAAARCADEGEHGEARPPVGLVGLALGHLTAASSSTIRLTRVRLSTVGSKI
jgi:hypothetical protein